jgi:Cytidylate kinase-like family
MSSDSRHGPREDPDALGEPFRTPSRPVVTLAAWYGAGGTVVGRQVAERLDVPFLDRGTLSAVAERTRVSEEAVAGPDDQQPEAHGAMGRFLGRRSRIPRHTRTPLKYNSAGERRYRAETEEYLARATRTGAVVLGRGGAVMLRSAPGALHVMLGGPRDARIRQAMALDGVDRKTAVRRQGVKDRARIEYVARSHRVYPLDADLYHLYLDTAALGMSACVDLIVAASQARVRQAARTTT